MSKFPEHALHLQLRRREVIAIAEVRAHLTVLPCAQVDLQPSISVIRSPGIDADLKDRSRRRFPELKLFQVGINSAKAVFHDLPSLCMPNRQQPLHSWEN